MRIPKSLKIIPEDTGSKETFDIYDNEENVRVLKYTLENKSYYLKTNLLDCEKYTLPVLTEYYHERWEIEEHFAACSWRAARNI